MGKAKGQVGTKPLDKLPNALQATPRGAFQSTSAGSDEGRRDFSRIFFANERKIFFMGKGLNSPQPLQVTSQPSSTHVGDLSAEVVEMAAQMFGERLASALDAAQATRPDDISALVNQIIPRMTVNVGLDFALHTGLMPAFLQPVFVIIALGEPLQFRVATYGFIAEKPDQVVGDRPETKRTPFVVRLLNTDLTPDDTKNGGKVNVHYSAWCVQAATTQQVVDLEGNALREACNKNSWDLLL